MLFSTISSTSNFKHSNYLDFIQQTASNLRNEFADLYGDENAAREILRRALITFDPSISNTTAAATTNTTTTDAANSEKRIPISKSILYTAHRMMK